VVAGDEKGSKVRAVNLSKKPDPSILKKIISTCFAR